MAVGTGLLLVHLNGMGMGGRIPLAQGNKLTLSMSRRGNCWDNAVAESFINSLKRELISGVNNC